MEETTKILISIGAATAANCVPCFEHYLKLAKKEGVSTSDIQEAIETATKVKGGAHLVFRNEAAKKLGVEQCDSTQCGGAAQSPCCG